jgi:hypothetical protein
MQQLQWIEIAFSAGAEECAAATGIADLRRLGLRVERATRVVRRR